MARTGTTQVMALQAVVAKLQADLGLDPRRCYLTVEPLMPPKMPPADWWVSVSPAESNFPEDMQLGGGYEQLTEYLGVAVTAYSRIRTDSTDHDEYLLVDSERGLLALKARILKSLAQRDLVDKTGEPFLRQLVLVTSSSRPYFDGQNGVGWITLNFSVPYDWVWL